MGCCSSIYLFLDNIAGVVKMANKYFILGGAGRWGRNSILNCLMPVLRYIS